MSPKLEIPKEVLYVTETLQKAGFKAFVVGGCTRDLLIGIKPKDWDVTTDATPEKITSLFPKTFYENEYGTVTVVQEDVLDETLKNIEITPFRLEGKYSNKRHPDEISFAKNLEDDLKRRDFTINAIAFDPKDEKLVDLYDGVKDIKDKVVRAVGNPMDRFNEDALRILRAIRIATELEFDISRETQEAIQKTAHLLDSIAKERIQIEFSRVTMSKNPKKGLEMAHELGVLKYIVPELEEGIGIEQNGDHIYHVWEHNLRAVQHSADRDWPLHVRIGAMLHDVGKPRTRRWNEEKKDWTFYGHDVVGARMAEEVTKRLKYPNKIVETVTKLVRHHLFFTDIEKITLSAVRRIVSHMGPENVWDLMKVRACDRIGMGRPKEQPYRLRKYESMIEEAMRDPISVKMLKIKGGDLIERLHVSPGPRMGWILHALLEDVLDDPSKNNEEYLVSRVTELNSLNEADLQKLGEKGKEKRLEEEGREVGQIRAKYHVK